MRVFMTSFAALLALVAFGPGVTTAFGGDNGTNVGTPSVAGTPAIPPMPAPPLAPISAPVPPPVPAPTLAPTPAPLSAPALAPASATAPAPMLSPTPAGQVRAEVGNPGTIQTPGASVNFGVPGNANVAVAANPGGDQWRYRWHNNNWWYWTTANRWVYRNGNEWVNYQPAAAAVPAVAYTNQPAYGYSSGPYGYTTGYRGYYSPVYQGGYSGPVYQNGYYYGSGGYYGQPGVSFGLGFGRGFRIGW